jgi:hypothetical protein
MPFRRCAAREQALLPSQEHGLEYGDLTAPSPVGRRVPAFPSGNREAFEEGGEGFEALHRPHEFLQILEPPCRFRRFVGLEHIGIARLFEHHLGEIGMGDMVRLLLPAREGRGELAERVARFGRELVGMGKLRRCREERDIGAARMIVQRLDGSIAEPAFGPVDDALEGKIIVALRHHAQISERIANLRTFIEAWAADHAIGQTQREKPVFEFAHLERGAHQHRHLRQDMSLAAQILRFRGDVARFLLGVPHARIWTFLPPDWVSVRSVCPGARLAAIVRMPRPGSPWWSGNCAPAGSLAPGKSPRLRFHLRAAPGVDRLIMSPTTQMFLLARCAAARDIGDIVS